MPVVVWPIQQLSAGKCSEGFDYRRPKIVGIPVRFSSIPRGSRLSVYMRIVRPTARHLARTMTGGEREVHGDGAEGEYLRKTRRQVLCQPTAKQRCDGPVLHRGRTAKDFSDWCPHKPQCIRIHGSDALRHHVHTDLVRLEIPKTKDAQDVVLRNFVLSQALQRELVGRSSAPWWHCLGKGLMKSAREPHRAST